MIKFFVGEEAVTSSRIYLEDTQDIKHLTRVLRAKVGDAVTIADGTGWEYETEIEEICETCVTLRIVDRQKDATEPQTRVTLFQGVPKAAKMETVIQKTVELGVDAIVPVFTARTVVVEKGNFSKKLMRWQKIADEAVKQCKRGRIPQVEPQIDFAEMCGRLADYHLSLRKRDGQDDQGLSAGGLRTRRAAQCCRPRQQLRCGCAAQGRAHHRSGGRLCGCGDRGVARPAAARGDRQPRQDHSAH